LYLIITKDLKMQNNRKYYFMVIQLKLNFKRQLHKWLFVIIIYQ